jgi:hypothetical protein
MVSIADFGGMPVPVLATRRTLTVALGGTSLALLLAIGAFLARGGGMIGSGYAARVALAAASLAFVIAYVAKPLSRLFHSGATRALGRESAGLTQSFAGMYAVFLTCIVLPYFLAGEVIPLPTLAFAILSILILAVMMFSTGTRRLLGSRAGRAMLGLSNAYFWCAFAANDLDQMVGPHRASAFDMYYRLSLILLVLALLVRFADAFVERRKVRMAEAL